MKIVRAVIVVMRVGGKYLRHEDWDWRREWFSKSRVSPISFGSVFWRCLEISCNIREMLNGSYIELALDFDRI